MFYRHKNCDMFKNKQSNEELQCRCAFIRITIKKVLPCVMYTLAILMLLSSCSGDDELQQNDNIAGHWSGVYSYYNPVSGIKNSYLNIDFYANGTGMLEFESPVSISVAYFTYQISGSTIYCTGARGNTSEDDIETDLKMTMNIEGECIKPLDRYTQFILTRDGSITTTDNGEVVVDKSNDLCGVWIREDKSSLIDFSSDGTYKEYRLDSSEENSYSAVYLGNYSYNCVKNWLIVDGNEFSILQLDISRMVIKSNSSKLYTYIKGTYADIPKQANISKFLIEGLCWSTKDSKCSFAFGQNGNVQYFENGTRVGSYGIVSLVANGTFTIKGNIMTCYFSDVTWEYSSSYPNMFPGWTANHAVTKTYTVEISNSCFIVIPSNGKTMYMYSLY